MIDGFVKSPSAALRFTPALLDQKLRIEGIGRGSDFQEEDCSWGLSNRVNRCSVPISTLHSSGFARLASGAFYFAIPILTFYEIIKYDTIPVNAQNILSVSTNSLPME